MCGPNNHGYIKLSEKLLFLATVRKEMKRRNMKSMNDMIGEQISKWDKHASIEEFLGNSQKFVKLMSYYKCAIMEVETKFKVLSEEYSHYHDRNPINNIQSRIKHAYSIMDKMERNQYPKSLDSIVDNLDDIAGVRVICSFPTDVYTMAEAFLKQDDITLIRKKDYIANPKSNGYRSLHLIVSIPIFLSEGKLQMKVEVQLRSIAMDFWASLEHQMKYKKDNYFTKEMEEELFQCAKISAALDERMDRLRISSMGEEDKADQRN